MAIKSATENLFFRPQTEFPKNFWTTRWDENKPTPFAAFQVKEGETVKPVLRIPPDDPGIQKDIAIHGKIVVPDGKIPESLSHLYVRALTHDNNSNFGMMGGSVHPDGKFVMQFKSNMNYAMNVYDANNEWAAKPLYVEVGPDTPLEESEERTGDGPLLRVIQQYEITLEKGTLIEGTALDHATGKPLASTTLWFFEYFDVTSKTTGEQRKYPINSPLVTNAEGKFRRAVVPGLYGVSSESAATVLFMPSSIEKAKITDPNDWEKQVERPATVFEVKPDSETIRPILRIVK